jgi:hypothetical protein
MMVRQHLLPHGKDQTLRGERPLDISGRRRPVFAVLTELEMFPGVPCPRDNTKSLSNSTHRKRESF